MFKEKVIVDGKLIPRFKYLKEKGCEKKWKQDFMKM
jgi:hypothetical protein